MLSEYREYKGGKRKNGLGIIDAYAKQEDKRFTGNVIAKLSIAEQYGFMQDKLLGFEIATFDKQLIKLISRADAEEES